MRYTIFLDYVPEQGGDVQNKADDALSHVWDDIHLFNDLATTDTFAPLGTTSPRALGQSTGKQTKARALNGRPSRGAAQVARPEMTGMGDVRRFNATMNKRPSFAASLREGDEPLAANSIQACRLAIGEMGGKRSYRAFRGFRLAG